jgi:hypothetical protein
MARIGSKGGASVRADHTHRYEETDQPVVADVPPASPPDVGRTS